MGHIAQLHPISLNFFFSPARASPRILFVGAGVWHPTGGRPTEDMGGILKEIHEILKEINGILKHSNEMHKKINAI